MSPIAIGLLAVSMSVDAFIAALGRGAMASRISPALALRTGAVFGAVEALTPLIGWTAGMAAARFITAIDHWIAFGLLAGVGLRMILQSPPRDAAAPGLTLWATLLTAVGTSIDAMAVGVSLALLPVNILTVAAAIGLTTAMMTTTGLYLGRVLGHRIGRMAETAGGLALVALGTMILIDHLSA